MLTRRRVVPRILPLPSLLFALRPPPRAVGSVVRARVGTFGLGAFLRRALRGRHVRHPYLQATSQKLPLTPCGRRLWRARLAGTMSDKVAWLHCKWAPDPEHAQVLHVQVELLTRRDGQMFPVLRQEAV